MTIARKLRMDDSHMEEGNGIKPPTTTYRHLKHLTAMGSTEAHLSRLLALRWNLHNQVCGGFVNSCRITPPPLNPFPTCVATSS